MRRMWDAAWPPTSPPPWEVAAGYVGGNTPHMWTDAEWARQPARYRLPIFVRSTGGIPQFDANLAVTWLLAHHAPKGCCVALDFETRVDPAYVRAFDAVITAAGWRTLLYGSRSTVRANPEPSGGYWDADWPESGPGVPHLNPGSAATQWSGSGPFGGAYDPSLVADATPLWDTKGEHMPLDATDLGNIEARVRKVLNEGTGAGKASWADTEAGILATVQALVNIVRGMQSTLAASIGDVRSAVLGAVAALPAPETPEQAQQTAQRVLDALAGLGVVGLSVDAVLDALGHRLTDEPAPTA